MTLKTEADDLDCNLFRCADRARMMADRYGRDSLMDAAIFIEKARAIVRRYMDVRRREETRK